jgi:hypothetical protein
MFQSTRGRTNGERAREGKRPPITDRLRGDRTIEPESIKTDPTTIAFAHLENNRSVNQVPAPTASRHGFEPQTAQTRERKTRENQQKCSPQPKGIAGRQQRLAIPIAE